MTVIRSSTFIERPVDEVFDFTVDLRNEKRWNPKVVLMEKITDGPFAVGTRLRGKWTKSKEVELELRECERPHRWQYHNGGPVEVVLTATFTEEDGGTRVETAFDATPHGFMKLVFPVFVRMMRKEEGRNMVLLKACLEGQPVS